MLDATTTGLSGQAMHDLARRLFPICRSLTGRGVRETLAILQEFLPALTLHEVPSGTRCFDWTVPDEWTIRDAYLAAPDGRKIVDFRNSNLHVVGYSEPVDQELSLEQLQAHLHSVPELPEAIPYVTSYYTRYWGFCLTERQRASLKPGNYRAVIDSELGPGSLTYGDLLIPGESPAEVLISTYVCHPSLANNEISGPVVAMALAQWVEALPQRRYSYRFFWGPETIGPIAYLSRHLAHLKRHVIAGFNVTCVGDDRAYSFMPSRLGGTLADQVALHVLGRIAPEFRAYSFLDRGSDERQYCAPGVDLPVVSVMRSKYATYREYHTSLDDLSLVTPTGLQGGYQALRRCLEVLEANRTYRSTCLCEPQMGKRGLRKTLSAEGSPSGKYQKAEQFVRMDILAYCDGNHSVLDIAERLQLATWDIAPLVDELSRHGLIEEVQAAR